MLNCEIWPVGQVVKTPPFHGGNMSSNLVRVIAILNMVVGGLAQLGEHLPYKQEVTGSSPVSSIVRGYRRGGSLFLCKRANESNNFIGSSPERIH